MDVEARNRETSRQEVAEFIRDKPWKYFAYVDEKRGVITTWTGDTLGKILALGRPWRNNMGDMRQRIIVRGINGVVYNGTYYRSAGDYCCLTAVKK